MISNQGAFDCLLIYMLTPLITNPQADSGSIEGKKTVRRVLITNH